MKTTTYYTHQETISGFICPICGYTECNDEFTCTDYFVSGENFDIVSCSGCGLRVTRHRLSEDALGAYYQSENYISHSNTRKGAINSIYHAARRLMLKKKRNWVEKQTAANDKKLLDVGCGTGYFAASMQKRGWNVVGVEKSDSDRKFAIEIKLEVVPSLKEIGGNNRFDTITLWHVLEHLGDLNHAMQSFNRLLTPQGTLFIAVPNHTSADAEKYGTHWAAYDVPRHLWHFAPTQMLQLAEKHGFRVAATRPFHLDGFYISILSEKYKGSSMYFIKGFFSGLNTWFSTLANTEKSSSLLYVLKKMPE
ncbi:MAG: class I SAM-dependent methyltransferase [Bacteroidia bacterium]|nr:class I SAM-dependent methyltransferase [Bacteroidia bacterium]